MVSLGASLFELRPHTSLSYFLYKRQNTFLRHSTFIIRYSIFAFSEFLFRLDRLHFGRRSAGGGTPETYEQRNCCRTWPGILTFRRRRRCSGGRRHGQNILGPPACPFKGINLLFILDVRGGFVFFKNGEKKSLKQKEQPDTQCPI